MTADQEPRRPSGPPDATTGSDRPADRIGSDRPDETKLTARLGAIADRHVPVPDWSDLVHRAELPPVIPLQRVGAGGGRRPFSRSVLAVAAALIVVIGAVGTFVVTRGGDDETVESGPAGPDDADVIDTGWYIPSPLPDGWKVTSIESSVMTLIGPGRLAVWASPDGSASLSYASEPLDDNMPISGPTIQLTDEISGNILDDDATGYPGAVVWAHDDQFHLVTGNGAPADDVAEAARQIAADPALLASPVDGMRLIDSYERNTVSQDTTDVTIGLQTAAGRKIEYQLSRTGGMARSSSLNTIPVVRTVAGQPLDVLELTNRPGLPDDLIGYLGIWPGADVVLPLMNYSYMLDNSQEPPTDEEVEALVRSLRPATADQWRAFLRDSGLEVDPSLLSAARLEDLSETDGADEGDESVSTATQPGQGGPTTAPQNPSDLAEPWPEEALALFDHSPNPQEWTAAFGGEGPVRSGTPFSLAPSLTNRGEARFDVHECTVVGTTIGILPVGTNQTVPRPDISGCDPTRVMFSIEPQGMADWPLPPLYADGIPTREIRSGPTGTYLGGTLAPGEYQMFISFALQSGINQLTSPATITEHPCGGFTTEFVDQFMGKTVAEADDGANQAGFTTRVVELDGVSQATTDDHRCDRVNLAVADGQVVAVVDVG